MAERYHTNLPGRSGPDPEPGGPSGVADQVELLAVQLLDDAAAGSCICNRGRLCGWCLLLVVQDNDYARAVAAYQGAAASLGVASIGPGIALGASAARFALSTTGRRGREQRESFANEQISGPFHRHDGYSPDGRPRCWCGSIAERDHSTGDLVCNLSGLELSVADNAAVMQSGRMTEAVDDMALTVEAAWRRYVVADVAGDPGELGLPAGSSRGDALAALHQIRATLHSVFGVDDARRAQLCLWPVAEPADADQHQAIAGDYEGTIGCLCGGPLSDGGGEGEPITCVLSGVVIWHPDLVTLDQARTRHRHLSGPGRGGIGI